MTLSLADIAAEADKYYLRNKGHDVTDDLLQKHLHSLPLKEKKVLEIGCLTGFRLAELAALGAKCDGIDASGAAIADGAEKYPAVRLAQGFAHELLYADATFDIVYMNFVLYTIPREFQLRTIAEMDRVLKDGGRLIIADFFPDAPHRRPDRHAEGHFTFKSRFWEVLVSSNLYTVVETIKHGFKSETKDDALEGGDDQSIIVDMQKQLEAGYPVRIV